MPDTAFKNSIQSSGRRLTRQRALVLEVLQQSCEHLDAEAIHDQVRIYDPRVSLATIYRTLNMLKELKLVDEYQLGEEHGHFEAAPYHPHYHFTCEKCHRVIEFDSPKINAEIKRLLEAQDLTITGINLQVSGICPECRNSDELGLYAAQTP